CRRTRLVRKRIGSSVNGLVYGTRRIDRLPSPRASSGISWKNFDWRSVRHGVPNFDDRSVSYGDAPLRPIAMPLGWIERTVVARQPVDEDRTSRVDPHCSCTVAVVSIGIGNVECAGVACLCRSPVDPVDTLRRAAVTLFFFWAARLATKRNRETLEHTTIVQELKRPVSLAY